jgi:hypothetical protein
MPCLDALPRYRAVEGAARTQRLAASHAMHANAARLAALQDDVAALGAFHFFHEDPVALSLVHSNVLALALGVSVLRSEWLAVLACF